jgi:hypothetical protein
MCHYVDLVNRFKTVAVENTGSTQVPADVLTELVAEMLENLRPLDRVYYVNKIENLTHELATPKTFG